MNEININTDFNKFVLKDLKELCKKYKIIGYSNKKKNDLIKMLNEKLKNKIEEKIVIENNNLEKYEIEKELLIKLNTLNISNENNFINFIDLFAGTGGFSVAFEKYNKFKCVFANDMFKESENIYKLNHLNTSFLLKDLHKVKLEEIPQHQILCGGFPCQPFSIAGEKKGFNDERSNVFWKILEIIKKYNPNIVILENVKNLKSHDEGNTYKMIEKNLKDLNYYIKSSILDTSKITNVPHHRERIYIVCFKDKNYYEKFNFNFPEVKNKKIKDFLENNIDKKYYYTDKLKIYNTVKNNITKNIDENVLYQYRRHYIRENKSNCCPTLTANMGSGGHNVPLLLDNKGIRKLTPRECFNLQGFPSNYKFPEISDSSLYKLAGNAISVPIVELIVDRINLLFE